MIKLSMFTPTRKVSHKPPQQTEYEIAVLSQTSFTKDIGWNVYFVV